MGSGDVAFGVLVLRALRVTAFDALARGGNDPGLSGTKIGSGGGVSRSTGDTKSCWSMKPWITSWSSSKDSGMSSGDACRGFACCRTSPRSVAALRFAWTAGSPAAMAELAPPLDVGDGIRLDEWRALAEFDFVATVGASLGSLARGGGGGG